MNKLTIISNGRTIEIIINKYKFIIGNNEEDKYLIINTLSNYFNKLSNSDYALDNEMASYLLYNDELLNIKDFEFFYVYPSFDVDLDVKLNSKSLSLMYINSLLDNIEYNETYQTIAMLMSDLYNELEIEENEIMPLIDFKFSAKELLKLISMSILKKEEKANNYDLNLEEKLILQLKMIKKISEKLIKKIIVYVKSPFLSTKILDLINDINAFILIDFNYTNTNNINDFILINNDLFIDIQNENALFDLCNNHYNHITIKEMKDKLFRDHLQSRILK